MIADALDRLRTVAALAQSRPFPEKRVLRDHTGQGVRTYIGEEDEEGRRLEEEIDVRRQRPPSGGFRTPGCVSVPMGAISGSQIERPRGMPAPVVPPPQLMLYD